MAQPGGRTVTEDQAALAVERLLQFARQNGMIEALDIYQSRNALLELLRLRAPYIGDVPEERMDSPSAVLGELLDYAAEKGILEADTVTHRDLLDAKIMGLLLPRPSEVVRQFHQNDQLFGMETATGQFYKLSIDSNYIRMDRIQKNEYWLAPTEYGEFEITINLSKPEKNPRKIAMLKSAADKITSHYPSCMLCIDNVGYQGRLDHPARQNLRVFPVKLDGEQWYFQYSPYAYYDEHCIVFHEKHVPMQISKFTFYRLLDFIEQFPHYFIGSNADLPIVGGSILDHDHFQGGRHQFPMEKASVETSFRHPGWKDIKVGIVNWPMSVLRISTHQRHTLIKFCETILDMWKTYSDPGAEIYAYTEPNGKKVPHNTITPIARNNGRGEYEIDLVLRNNRTSQEHPDGIFHPHQNLHHIKKENIGLIEVMGVAVLPGRLKEELRGIRNILTGKQKWNSTGSLPAGLQKHKEWINWLVKRYGKSLTEEEAERVLQQETGRKFKQVLEDSGVFKRTEEGQAAFRRFLGHLGFEKM
ncbi:UDP-glucose--hexose-1-phosphate uridylyltransferase [Paenibacillus larvae]